MEQRSLSPPSRILVVDDDRIIVEILKQSLALAGYNVTAATDGQEGLELARRLKPDLILLDVMMPKVDGYTVCRMLKQNPETQLIPIIILTALTDKDDKLKALEVGADEFIRKPPDRQELLIRIKSLLRIKQLYDQVQSSYHGLRALEQTRHDLTSMLVHDMRGPLGTIMGTLEVLLKSSNALSQQARETLLTGSLLSSQRIMIMFEAMLDVQKLETGQMPVVLEPVVIGLVIDELVQAMTPLLKADRIVIDTRVEQPTTKLMLDKGLLARVVNNLLFNAIKFSPAGGRIGIWTQVTARWVIINVADQGPGIPSEHRERIFEKYAQLEAGQLRGGFGLGLAFCKMAVEAMKGRIWVEDMPRAGALFRLALPARQPTDGHR